MTYLSLGILTLTLALFLGNGKMGEGVYDDLISEYSKEFQVDPFLVKAILKAESGFNPRALAIESKNRVSYGLGQILYPDTAKALGFEGEPQKLFHPGLNIYYVCKLLSDIEKRYPLLRDTIASYNSGRPIYDSQGVLINLEYVNRVESNYYKYRFGIN